MNHAKIAAEALRFRMSTLQHTLLDPHRFDIETAATIAVTCGDPTIDSAIRRLGTAWVRAGLEPERMSQPWDERDAGRLLECGGTSVIDALDDIVRGVAAQASLSSSV
ncbi:MAG TPA: hypothetical protein VF183_08905 [Acidimicrobiales bacterium]